MLLRPEFTQQLTQRLLGGENINLISPHGQGRRRTIQDLMTVLPDDVEFFQIDLKRFQGDIGEWFQQTVEHLQIERQASVLLVHNCDDIHAGVLLHLLSSIICFKSCGVLCVSEMDDRLGVSGVERLLLPSITQSQLMLELKNRDIGLKQEEFLGFSKWLLKQTNPYTCLDTLGDDWYKKELWKS